MPALKPTLLLSGMWIVAPLRGLRPLRAARVRISKVPKPTT